MGKASLVTTLLLSAFILGTLGCESADTVASTRRLTVETSSPESAPILLCSDDDPYELALAVKLPETTPLEATGLENVYKLGDRILSGSEPHGEAAFAALAKFGVRTILTVDGKSPDVELAQRYGLRYVHVPTRYKGMSDTAVMRLSKTFREAEAPFYVHCFHGRHRGPAAAALGRLVLDGVDRKVALAEMRQWCGTASKYAGLYRDIATKAIPDAATTRALDWELAPQVSLEGYRQAMTAIVRSSDALKVLEKRAWQADPDHPDVDAINEADKLADLFERSLKLDEMTSADPELRRITEASALEARKLHELLKLLRGGDATAVDSAKASFKRIRGHCGSCHKKFRND